MAAEEAAVAAPLLFLGMGEQSSVPPGGGAMDGRA